MKSMKMLPVALAMHKRNMAHGGAVKKKLYDEKMAQNEGMAMGGAVDEKNPGEHPQMNLMSPTSIADMVMKKRMMNPMGKPNDKFAKGGMAMGGSACYADGGSVDDDMDVQKYLTDEDKETDHDLADMAGHPFSFGGDVEEDEMMNLPEEDEKIRKMRLIRSIMAD